MSTPLLDLGDGAEVRVLEPDDAEEVFLLVDAERERLREWMPWVDSTRGPDEIRRFIERDRAGEDLDALGIFVDGAYVGGIGLRVDSMHREAEMGYWIGSGHEGRGLVTRACRALVDLAFDRFEAHRTTIRVAPTNARSRAIPERLGFTLEATLREAGRTAFGYHDLVVYGLLEDEWPPG